MPSTNHNDAKTMQRTLKRFAKTAVAALKKHIAKSNGIDDTHKNTLFDSFSEIPLEIPSFVLAKALHQAGLKSLNQKEVEDLKSAYSRYENSKTNSTVESKAKAETLKTRFFQCLGFFHSTTNLTPLFQAHDHLLEMILAVEKECQRFERDYDCSISDQKILNSGEQFFENIFKLTIPQQKYYCYQFIKKAALELKTIIETQYGEPNFLANIENKKQNLSAFIEQEKLQSVLSQHFLPPPPSIRIRSSNKELNATIERLYSVQEDAAHVDFSSLKVPNQKAGIQNFWQSFCESIENFIFSVRNKFKNIGSTTSAKQMKKIHGFF